MAKTKEQRAIETEPTIFYGPGKSYYLTKEQPFHICQRGDSQSTYCLDSLTERTRLLNEFLKIFTPYDVLEWTNKNGLVAFERKNGTVFENKVGQILKAADSLRALVELHEASKKAEFDHDFDSLDKLVIEIENEQKFKMGMQKLDIGFHGWQQTPLGKAFSKKRETGLSLYSFIQEVKKQQDGDANLTRENRSIKNDIAAFEEKLNKETWVCLPSVNSVFYFAGYNKLKSEDLPNFIYSRQEWEDERMYKRLLAAKTYLVAAANIMLQGIRPKLAWEYNREIEDWQIIQSYVISCPWQAIAVEFSGLVRKGPINLEYCRKCGQSLKGMRPDARVCKDWACRKYATRKLERLREYTKAN